MTYPWMRFHTRDWLDNKELRRCSPLARSVLSDLMCLAHEGEPYGHLADKVGPLTVRYMASRCVVTNNQFLKALSELETHGRIKTSNGVLFIPRMVEDEALRVKMAEGGRKGGNPSLRRKVGGEVNLPDNPEDKHARARADSDSDSSTNSHEVIPFVPPRKAHVLDESFMLFMSEVALTGTPLIEADYEDAFGEWKHLDSGEQLMAVRNFREKREAGMFADPALVMRPAKWLKRKEFNRRAIQARGSPPPKLTATQMAIQRLKEREAHGECR